MLNKLKQRKEAGFTIVEVMIVLAIAGLIILVVFLAVPALQRNSRNTQRTSDVSLIGGAVNECLNNRNGDSTACTTATLKSYYDTSKMSQVEAVTVTTSTTAPNDTTTVNVVYGKKCKGDGSGVDTTATGVSKRAVVLMYNTENSTGGSISRCQEV